MVKKPFKYTHVGRLPEDWDCLQAIEVIDEISMGPFGSDITVSNFVSSGVPVLNGYNVSQIMLIDKFQNFVTPKKAKELKKAVAHRGDIIVTHRGTIGQVSYIPDSSAYSEYVISQSQFRVHFNDKRVNSHFLVSYLLSPIGQKYLLETKGHTGVPALAQPTTNFRRLWIPLPEIAEQVAIAEALSNVDSLISSLQKLIEKKKAIKQGATQELLTGKKRLPGFCGVWKKKWLCDLAADIKTGTKNNEDKVKGGKYPFFVRSANVEKINSYSYDCEAILVPGEGNIGEIFHYINGKFDCHQRVYKISDFRECIGLYIFYYLKMFFGAYALLNTVKATVDSLRLPTFQNFIIYVPSDLKEQQAIAQALSDMDSEIEQLEKKLAKYQQIKQGMMQELLTGRIRLA